MVTNIIISDLSVPIITSVPLMEKYAIVVALHTIIMKFSFI